MFGRQGEAIAFLCVFLLFVAYSLIQANIPGVNEPHYLTKARHVWDPDWCAGDLFLESSNPHLVFYRTVGAFAAITTFPVAALVGRLLGLAVLAYGWQRLTTTLTALRWSGFVSASLFLAIATIGNWSGEWVVGGIESKVLAYGFAFWATAGLLDGHVLRAGLLAGMAVSFHPIVGIWWTGCLAVAVVLHCTAWVPISKLSGLRTSRWLAASGLFLLAASPGVLAAAAVVGGGTPELALEATRYQVTRRLAHHLNPFAFSAASHAGAIALLCVWGLLAGWLVSRWLPARDQQRLNAWYAIAITSVAVALAGVIVGIGLPESDLSVKLLKFYPFRLADVIVPWTVCVIASALLLRLKRRWHTRIVAFGAALFALCWAAHDRDSSRMSAAMKRDWIGLCRWVQETTPEGTLCLAAETRWAFKWFAERPEYVNHKDCPQDPESIAEFRRRQRVLYDWSTAATEDMVVTPDELAELRRLTGIDFFIVYRFGTIETLPTHQTKYFRVYDLRST